MFYIPLNINVHAASTTIQQERIEFVSPCYSTQFDRDLIDSSGLWESGFVSVQTTFKSSENVTFGLPDDWQEMSSDFDIVSKIQFKRTKVINVRIVKTKFEPFDSMV